MTETVISPPLQDEIARWRSERLPTEDELPCSDGIPMETQNHVWQMALYHEKERAERLAARLRELGIEPEV